MENKDAQLELIFAKKVNRYLGITVGILLLYIILSQAFFQGSDKEVIPNYNYVTDTVYVNKSFDVKKQIDKEGKLTPPKIIKIWLKPEPIKIDSLAIINNAIAIYKENKFAPIIINGDFATQNIESSKLLTFDLKKDSLSITIQQPDAQTTTKNYPLYFKDFQYQWYDNELHHTKIKSSQTKSNQMSWTKLYINGGYEFLSKKPTLGLEYNLEPGRFKIDLNSQLTTEQIPQFYLNAKIGYRLFK